MTVPAVSVILTSYNQRQWLRQSVDSVLAQTFEDWELILIDNGSTDGSVSIAEEYRRDPRVVVVRHDRNEPHTVISNDAVRRSRGRYVSFLYSDDYYLPAKLARQVPVLDSLGDRYGVVYSAGYRLMPDGSLRDVPFANLDGDVLEPLVRQEQFFMPISPLVRREALLRYPFNETIFMEGEGIFTKLALGYHFHPLPEPLAVMRDHATNMGKEIVNNLKRGVIMCEEIFDHPEMPARLRPLKGHVLGTTYRLGGWQMIRRLRDYKQGRLWLTTAVRYEPALAFDPRVLAGLTLALLPSVAANACLDLLNATVGAPPAPPVNDTPVEGRRLVSPHRGGD